MLNLNDDVLDEMAKERCPKCKRDITQQINEHWQELPNPQIQVYNIKFICECGAKLKYSTSIEFFIEDDYELASKEEYKLEYGEIPEDIELED